MIKILALISLGFMASCSSQMFDGRFDFSEILQSPQGSPKTEREVHIEVSQTRGEDIPEVEEKPSEESTGSWSFWESLYE